MVLVVMDNAVYVLFRYRCFAVPDLSQIGGQEVIRYVLPLLGSFLGSGISQFVLFPILCLAFVATVPVIIRRFFRG